MEQNTKIITWQSLGISIALLVIYAIIYLPSILPDYNSLLSKTADEMSKTCPKMVDKGTRLDKVEALPNNIFQYNYTMVNVENVENSIEIVDIKSKFETEMLNAIKTEPGLKVFRDNNTTLGYRYLDKNGAEIFKVLITPDQYNNK